MPSVRINSVLYGKYSGPFFNGLILATWAIWVLLPFNAFDNENFRVLEEIAPEVTWGGAMLALSATMVVASFRRDRWLVSYGAVLAGVAYLMIWASYAASDWRGPSGPVYLILAIRCFLISKRFSVPSDPLINYLKKDS